MSKTKEKPILRDPEVFPSSEVLQDLMGKNYFAYDALMQAISSEEVALDPQWIFYNDVKNWLCKIVYKKKTIIWLSVYADRFTVVFYFNKKTAPGVFELDIPQDLKDQFNESQMGKNFKPMIFEVRDYIDLDVILKMVEYKKKN